MTNWIGRDKELYQSLGEAYSQMYEMKGEDPLDKQRKQKEEGRQKAKDAAAKVGIDRVLKGEPKKTPLEMARENRAKKKTQLKNPNINQGMREDVEDDMEIIDEYDVTYADGCMIEEGKKKCKEGYKWDSEKGKCVKKKKKSSSSKTVVVVKGRGGGGYYGPGYIHGGHGGSNGGDNGDNETEGGGDGGDGGGGGE